MFRAPLQSGFELRLLEERHAATIFATVDQQRAYLRRWLPWVDATQVEDDTLSFIRSSREQFAANNGFAAGIWDGDTFAGVVGTHKIDWLNRRVEMGYWISESLQGKGIMTDACRTAIMYLFTDLDLNRVEILCSPQNERSAAIPRRLGFTLEGTLRGRQLLHGHYHDMLAFAMLKRDWLALGKSRA